MDIRTVVINEMKKSSSWTRYLLKDFDASKEFDIPTGLKSNINWQVGHIMLSRHFHSVVSTFGKQDSLMEEIPFVEYAKLYAMGSDPSANIDTKPSIETMMKQLRRIDETSIDLIENMDLDQMNQDPLRAHPVAKTKYDALMWSSQHQMWHNGQIASLKSFLK